MSEFAPNGSTPTQPPPPAGFQPDWPGRRQGLPPPPPGLVWSAAGLGSGAAKAAFDIESPGILKMAFAGSLLQFITLGIYRFWFLVTIRRQLWQRSSLLGSSFEYTGTPGEIFKGFLLALILLTPIWGAYAAGTALLQTVQYRAIAGILTGVSVIAFLFFVYFATYRARRYRVSRTLWRGVRFHQTGSGFLYAVMTFGWWLMVLPTLGLSIPFARAQLERYRINHMWFGNKRFVSKASGGMMLGPYLLYYAAIFGPVLIGVAIWIASQPPGFMATISKDLTAVGKAIATEKDLPQGSTASVVAAVFGVFGIVWLYIMPFLLWPAYRACEIRRFIGRISFGQTRFRATFTALEIYVCTIIFGLITSGVFTGLGILAAIGAALVFALGAKSDAATVVSVIMVFLGYLIVMLFLSVLRLRIFLFELTGRLIASITVDGVEHLEDVISQPDFVGAIGDDFAGGFDIGAI